MIQRTPGAKGGRPCIAGTGLTVKCIAVWHQKGMEPEEIVAQYGNLSLAQVHAALAYYYANRSEIDGDIADEISEYESLVKESRETRNPKR